MLTNLYMNRFLKHGRITEQSKAVRAQVVTYADDFVILSRGLIPGNVGEGEAVRVRLNQTLQGWSGYFSCGSRATAYRDLNNYVARARTAFPETPP
jgi:Group II intron, maturase-specific domain